MTRNLIRAAYWADRLDRSEDMPPEVINGLLEDLDDDRDWNGTEEELNE